MVLDDVGYPDVPIYAPNQASNFFKDLGIVGDDLLRPAWQGIVAIDLLNNALLETRPYETEPGSAETAFARSIADFKQVPVDRSVPRPRIGIVGEFYIRANRFSNQGLISKVEALGGEVWTAPVNEWFLYRNVRRGMRAKLDGQWWLWFKNLLIDRVMQKDERRLAAAFDGFLRNTEEPSTVEVLSLASPYVHLSFEGEAIMTVGKAVDTSEENAPRFRQHPLPEHGLRRR